MKILGIWDGHDSGAALVDSGRLTFAINEERLTRRKLEVHFPSRSIDCILRSTGTSPSEIGAVVYSTTDPSKTLTRIFPGLKEEFYAVRRRKRDPGNLTSLKRRAKYLLTELRPRSASEYLSTRAIRRHLEPLGLGDARIISVDHHAAHAASAAFTSGMEAGTVITVDGIGDAASGSVWRKSGGKIDLVRKLPGHPSLGLFFEISTFLLNMRELEDEGKVMALAAFAHPHPFQANPFKDLFWIGDGAIRCRCSSTMQLHQELRRVHWRTSSEDFAYFVQQTFEQAVLDLFRAHTTEGAGVAYAGGAASNVKANMQIRETLGVRPLYVFPHMGDGGLAAGAALFVSQREDPAAEYEPLNTLQIGPAWTNDQIEQQLRQTEGINFQREADIAGRCAELLEEGEIVFWFQGPMEYGPRALGGRSILARPDSIEVRDRLNLRLKRRASYQPFCPSMLKCDADAALENFGSQPEPFMTAAYRVRSEYRDRLKGVTHIDGTCRPQVLDEAALKTPAAPYFLLLQRMRERIGIGALLNTSFNLHGEPMVCSPEDALRSFLRSGARYCAMGEFLVEAANG